MKLILHIDKGLAAHLKANAKGVGIYGGVEETAIAFIRNGLIRDMSSATFRDRIEPHLPKRYRGQGAVYDRRKLDEARNP